VGFFRGAWFSVAWPNDTITDNISVLELFAVYVAVLVWVKHLSRYCNVFADLLSRLQVDQFKLHSSSHQQVGVMIPCRHFVSYRSIIEILISGISPFYKKYIHVRYSQFCEYCIFFNFNYISP